MTRDNKQPAAQTCAPDYREDPLEGFDTEVSGLLALQEILERAGPAKVRAEAVSQILDVFIEAFIARVKDWGDERDAGKG